MYPEFPACSEDEDSTISAGTSELDLRLSSSDDEDVEEPEHTVRIEEEPVQEPKTPEEWEEFMLSGRQPVVVRVEGCAEHQGHLVYLVRERFKKVPIVVPASYVDRNFPQISIRFYESLLYRQLETNEN